MPLTAKGKKILRHMQAEYGPEKGRTVFYASINKGRIRGAEVSRGAAPVRETPSKRKPAG